MVELGPLFFILAFFLGASFGSFACAAASRTEAGVKWWGRERSRCDGCGAVLAPRDLVPVLSFLALRGRCRFCGARIPRRCFAAELVCGALCALFLWRFGASYSFLLSSASLPFLAFHTITDADTGYIYDSWAFAMAGAGLLLRLAGGFSAVLDGAAGAAAGFAFIYAIIFLSRGRMGAGDAVLMLGIGSFMGLKFTAAALYIGFMAGGVTAIALLAAKKVTRKSAVPLGPFLCFGSAAAMLFGGKFTEYLGFTVSWPWISQVL